jgi:ABC-type nitrate/sulfonate/bicarbonate transport system permease component
MMSQGWKKGWRPVGVLILFFAIWEAVGRWGNIPAWLLPTPSRIVNAAMEVKSTFSEHLLSTLQLTFTGFLLGITFGLMIAIILHLLPGVREAVYPLLILSQNVPIIVLAPLLVIWFGFGILPKLIVITLVCFFPVAVATLDGFQQTAPELRLYMAMAGASKWQTFWKLEFPYALPSIFSGLKISATYSVMGAVISEWLGAKAGIGVFMTLASSSFRTDRVFVAIMAIMLFSLLFFWSIVLLEKLVVRWKEDEDA